MKTYYIYILECNDSSYYTGVTNDYIKREWEHNQGLDPKSYTYSRRPVKTVYIEEFNQVLDAINREKQLKKWSKKKKQSLINHESNKLIQYSKRKRKQKFLK